MPKASEILNQSDEDFLNSMPPEVSEDDRAAALAEQEQQQAPQTEQEVQKPEGQDDNTGEKPAGEIDKPVNQQKDKPAEEKQDQGENLEEGKKPEAVTDDKGGEAADKSGKVTDDKASTDDKDKPKDEASTAEDKKAKENEKPSEEKPKDTPAVVNYEDAGKLLLAPLKANGKDIEIRSPEEARRLMQMGANYTKKMQELQPTRNLVRMLESNGLLDPTRLSYLIDLDKKNPEAIKKLIKDSGIDPLTIDVSVDPAYQPGNYQPSQEEDRFRTTLDDVNASEGGQETVQHIHENWDLASKNALWENPEILKEVHKQRQNGIYDLITAELDRLKVLGEFQNTPFLEAYTKVGDQLAASGDFQRLQGDLNKPKSGEGQGVDKIDQPKPEPKILDTRAAIPKSPVDNGDKARAAAPSAAAVSTAKQLVNPLAMSDEEFMQTMSQRL